jgi:cbb3-type cytochrome oxidase maturation protein
MSLLAFLWALRSGQYEDLDGAGARILLDPEDERAQPVTRRDWRPTTRSPE